MDWKFVLIFSLITMAIDSSLAKRRKVHGSKTLSPACSKCLDEIQAEKSDGSEPAARSRYKPHSAARRRNLSSSCVSCIKFLETKRKRMGSYKVSKNRLKNPKHGKHFRPDFRDRFEAVAGMKQFPPDQAPARESNINYHFHFFMKNHPGSPETSDSTMTSQFSLESDEYGSEMAQSNFEVIAPAANEITQVSEETAQSISAVIAAGNETTQVGGETTQSSSEVSTTGNETTQVSGQTTQSSSEVSAAGNETTQVSGETTQSTSEVNVTSSEAVQTVVVTAQCNPESGNGTTQKDGGQCNEKSALAVAVALFVPVPASFLGSRANVNYDYD